MSGEMVIKYDTLALSQQVLERQRSHADRIATYLPANADIGDSTGALLSLFDPLSKVAVDLGVQAAHALGQVEGSTAAAVGDVAVDLRDSDGKVGESFGKILSHLGGSNAPGSYPDLQGPPLGAAGESAPDGYGGVESYFFTKAYATGQTLGGGITSARDLVDSLGDWGSSGKVGEVTDASSFLVPGQAPDNFVQDLRWSAGALLGSIDWVAEKFLGFSILERCVYHPLGGDWQGIYRCAEAWNHAGDALTGVARNHAGLVASTPATWEGLSGNSFRVAMGAIAEGCLGLSTAFAAAGSYTKTISAVCKLACTGIGAALNTIANILLDLAEDAAVPVFGWVKGAFDAYDAINKVIRNVRLINTIIETVASAIQDFAEAKTAIFDKLGIIEDLAQGAAQSAAS